VSGEQKSIALTPLDKYGNKNPTYLLGELGL
jgi:hypothetical protein